MPSWLLKAALQGAIAPLPARHRINRLLQRHLTGSLALSSERFEAKLAQCARHLERFAAVRGGGALPATALEIGTGWQPIVPLGLALAGVREVTTFDVAPLLDRESVTRVLERYARALETGALASRLPSIERERARELLATGRARGNDAGERAGDHSPAAGRAPTAAWELLAHAGVRAHVGTLAEAGLRPGSIELIVSNNTLEHIPPAELADLFGELARLAAPGAVMDHFIDLSDHYAHFDRSLSELNFLRFPARTWRLFNNRLHYQNRLRIGDYTALIERAGFRVVDQRLERGSEQALAQISLAPEFRHYRREELLVLRAWITARA